MGKLNLLVDGNYLLHKSVFKLFSTKTLYSELDTLMHVEFEKLRNLYPFDNVYFLTDDKLSWRKKEYSDYKGNRTKDETIDWEYVYKTYDEFIERLKLKKFVKTVRVSNAEGDDLIAYIVKESNKLGYSNMVISADGDLYQLLDYSLNDSWINMIYNSKISDETIHLPNNYKVFLNHIDSSTQSLFDDSDMSEFSDFIRKFIAKVKIVENSKEECLFLKLVSGDSGDNISSVYESLTTTGKIRGIGIKGAQTVYSIYKNSYPEDIDFNSANFVNRLADTVCFWKKTSMENLSTVQDNVEQKIKRNLKLIVLDKHYIPERVYTEISNNVELL